MVDPSRLGSSLLVTLPSSLRSPLAHLSSMYKAWRQVIDDNSSGLCYLQTSAHTLAPLPHPPTQASSLSFFFFFLFLLSTPLAPTWVMLSPSRNEVRKVMVRHIVQLRLSANGPSIIKGQAAADTTRCLCFPNENRWCFCLSEQLLHSAFNAAVNQLAGWLKAEDLCNLQQEEIAQNYW